MRLLFTGAESFLGSHLSESLLAKGNQIIGIDNIYTGNRANISHILKNPSFEFMRHDVTFPHYAEVDGIFNLACPASPVCYQGNPDISG